MKKQDAYTFQLTKKEFNKLAKLLYFGQEITSESEDGHRSYHAALDSFFNQAQKAGMGKMADIDAIGEEEDVQKMLESYREEVSWQFFVVEFSIRDMIQQFEIDIHSSKLGITDLTTSQKEFLLKRANFYSELLTKEGIDCIKIIERVEPSAGDIVVL